MFLISLVALAAVLALLRWGRYRCAHNDPLCRRERPCIACYRELYKVVVDGPHTYVHPIEGNIGASNRTTQPRTARLTVG